MALTANRKGFEVSYVRQDNPARTADFNWIKAFASQGGNAIVSGDYDILQHWPNLVAYSESGLIAFFPPPAFGRLKGYGRAAFLIRWWPAIIEKIKEAGSGTAWRINMTWTPSPNGFDEIRDPRIETARAKGEIKPVGKVHQFRPRS